MKKSKLLIFTAALGLVLTSCGGADPLPLEFDEDDLVIDTPWEEYHVPVSSVNFADSELDIELNKGDTYEYKATIRPMGTTLADLNWKSSDESVVTVSKGKVTAVGAGSATITVSENQGLFDPISLNVTVQVPLQSISLGDTMLLDWNETRAVPVEFTPSDTTYRELTWASSDESIATVENGLVTTTGKTGVVTITATSAKLSAPVTVSVDVADRTIHVETVSLTVPSAIEIGKATP